MSKKNKHKVKHLPFRLNILFLLIFILFSALVFRLGFIQIVHGEEYLEDTERSSAHQVYLASPRGWMMDRNGEILVNNVPAYTITYTQYRGVEQDEKAIAKRLSEIIEMDEASILKEMDNAELYEPQRIKQEISDVEMARVSEHKHELPGIEIMEDPIRHYPHGDLFRQFLGREGDIPSEEVNDYLARGYRLNERVGVSYLEEQYEDELRGREGTIEMTLDRAMRAIDDPEITPGRRGNDLMLTIDIGLQQKIEEVIARFQEEDPMVASNNEQIDRHPQFVAMDPLTGEILGMSNNVYAYAQGGYWPGSTMKMATVLTGLHEGLYGPYDTVYDQTMRIGADGHPISSWRSLRSVNAYQAIQQSSNIYMAHVGLRLAGSSAPNWNLGPTGTRNGFELIRQYYSQFGLGVKTGIDLPGESPGRIHESPNPGNLAQNTFGQHDQYTPLQMAQFVSTIANGGYRMQPHLVKEIRRGTPIDDGSSKVIWQKEPNVLNRIDMSDDHIQVVQQGMEMVAQTRQGTAWGHFQGFEIDLALKTGTAQTGVGTPNHTVLVGYAPADDPQFAFACIVPFSQDSSAENVIAPAQQISKEILEYYFGLDDEGEESDDEDEEEGGA